MTRNEEIARALAFFVPVLLLAGALGSQYLGGLFPCEMCHWQRWPHAAAAVVAGLAFLPSLRGRRTALVTVAALLIGLSGAIGLFHAGVEYGLWHGFTACSAGVAPMGTTAADRLAAIMNAPAVPCDVAQWRLAGVSLAGFNAVLSLGTAATILALIRRRRRTL